MPNDNLTLTAKIRLDTQSLNEVERRISSLNDKVSASLDKNVNALNSKTQFVSARVSESKSYSFKERQSGARNKKSEEETEGSLSRNLKILNRNLKSYSEKIYKSSQKYSEDKEYRIRRPAEKINEKLSGAANSGKKSGLHGYFSGVNQVGGGNFPVGFATKAGVAGLAAFAAYKAVQVGYDIIKSDFDTYSQSADTGLSASTIKFLKSGVETTTGNQLLNTFSQSSQYADFNRFGDVNQLKSVVQGLVFSKNAGYLEPILSKHLSGVEFQKEVINATLKQYSSGAFGKVGSPEAKQNANYNLQQVLGGNFDAVIQSFGDKTRTKGILDNLTDEKYSKDRTSLVSEGDALKVIDVAANINLQASNTFHDAVNIFLESVKQVKNNSSKQNYGYGGVSSYVGTGSI